MLVAPAGATASPLPADAAYVTNGNLSAVAIDDTGRTYLGGSFSRVGPRTGHAIKLTGANDQPAGGFPDVNGTVLAATGDGSGGWFIGGDFTAVGGVTRNRLAHVLGDGALDGSWDPGASGTVKALAVSGTDLYVGGAFTSAGGQPRNNIAKLAATGTGAADATWNPNATGAVNALAVSDTDLYVGGVFNGANSIGGQARNRIAQLETTDTGDADATWNPNATDEVRALVVSGTDLYVGGSFNGANSIGGQARNRIAKLDTTGTGAADATWDPSPTGTVSALAVSGTDLYVGGFFTSIGGQPRNDVAKLETTDTGAADATWNPFGNSTVSALALSGTDLYVGGSFSEIGGQPRTKIAKLTTTGTGAADPNWDANTNEDVRALAVSGSSLYAGGLFTSAGALNRTRFRIARLNPDGTLDATWDPGADGAVSALALSGTDVYIGGTFSSIGGQPRNGIAKLSTTSPGAADPNWNPSADFNVNALAVAGTDLYAGGGFSFIGGQGRNAIAKLSTTGAGAADAAWNPNANGTVNALALSGGDLYVGGQFTGAASIGGQARNRIAKLATTGNGEADATWDPNANGTVIALALSGTDLYAGGTFNGAASIGGQARNRIAKLATTGTGAADATWDFDANADVFAVAASGPRLAVGGQFTTMGPFSTRGLAMLLPPPGPPPDTVPPAPPPDTVPPAPSNTALPAITGTTTQGRMLSVTDGTWTDSPTSFARQWLRCDGAGTNCSNIEGAATSSYLLRADDVGHVLRAVVTATNAGGATSATSDGTAKIAPPPLVLSGARFASSKFTAKRGTKLTLTLSHAAAVGVVVTQRVKGRRVAGKCRRKAKKGRKCHLTVRRAKLSFHGSAGRNTFTFRVAKLKPGSYSAKITARDTARVASRPVTLKFKIK